MNKVKFLISLKSLQTPSFLVKLSVAYLISLRALNS